MAECEKEVEHERIAAMQSDCVYDYYCEYCKDDGLNTEAEGYCVDCNDYLCQGCINAHKRSRTTRHHELLDQNKMPREASLSQDRVNREIVTKCILHNTKSVEYYCVSHRELVCSACFVKVHRHCKEIQSIHEESESIIGSREHNDFTDGLKDMNKKASDIISKAHDNKAALDRFATKATEQLKSFRAEVNARFDEMEKSLLTEIRSTLSEDNEAMDKMTEQLTKISDKAKALIAETEKLADSKLVCQLFIQIKAKHNNLVSLKETIRQAEERNKVRMIEFEANNDIRTAFKTTGLGKIKVQTRCANSNVKSPATVKTGGDQKSTHCADAPYDSSTQTAPLPSDPYEPLRIIRQGMGTNDPCVSRTKIEPQAPTKNASVGFTSSSKSTSGNLHIVELSEDRIYYDREFLLQLRYASASMTKPEGLPDIPDFMNIQPSTDQELVKQMEEIIEKDKEPYVLPTRAGQIRIGHTPKPRAGITKEDKTNDQIYIKAETKPARQNKRKTDETEAKAAQWTEENARSSNYDPSQPSINYQLMFASGPFGNPRQQNPYKAVPFPGYVQNYGHNIQTQQQQAPYQQTLLQQTQLHQPDLVLPSSRNPFANMERHQSPQRAQPQWQQGWRAQ